MSSDSYQKEVDLETLLDEHGLSQSKLLAKKLKIHFQIHSTKDFVKKSEMEIDLMVNYICDTKPFNKIKDMKCKLHDFIRSIYPVVNDGKKESICQENKYQDETKERKYGNPIQPLKS